MVKIALNTIIQAEYPLITQAPFSLIVVVLIIEQNTFEWDEWSEPKLNRLWALTVNQQKPQKFGISNIKNFSTHSTYTHSLSLALSIVLFPHTTVVIKILWTL